MNSPLRGFIVLGLLALGSLAVFGRLIELKVLKYDALARCARINTEGRLKVEGPRGDIVDRHGRILAISIPTSLLAVHPPGLSRETLRSIDRAAGTHGRLTSRAHYKTWLTVTPHCDFVCSQKIQDLLQKDKKLAESVRLEPSFERRYPAGRLASHVLGFVNDEGVAEGIEGRYNELLRAPTQDLVFVRDAKQKVLDARRVGEKTEDARSVMLTLDLRIQDTLESALRQAAIHHGARSAQGVVLDPANGEILALANWPDYDPNHFGSGARYHRNPAVMSSFEPGSVIKALAAVAVVDAGNVDPFKAVYCEKGSWKSDQFRGSIRDHHPYEWLTLPEVLTVSSNVGISKYTSMIAAQKLHQTLTAFGIGRKTGVDLPAEDRGTLRPLSKWRGRDRFAASFGYVMRATTLQLATAYAALATGGRTITPRVARAQAAHGSSWQRIITPETGQRVTSPETARLITRWLEQVVQSEHGTGRAAAIPGFLAAGKTGTAEILEQGKYARRKNISTFVGYAPAQAPRVVVAITINEATKNGRQAGSTAAPVFAQVMSESLRLLHAIPETSPPAMAVVRPKRTGVEG